MNPGRDALVLPCGVRLQEPTAVYCFSLETPKQFSLQMMLYICKSGMVFHFFLAIEGDAQPESCGGNDTKDEMANEKLEEMKAVGGPPS